MFAPVHVPGARGAWIFFPSITPSPEDLHVKLSIGLSKKLGLPDYGSLGASCNVEVELDNSLISEHDKLQQHVRRAYVACAQAVNDELARQRTPANGAASPNKPANDNPSNGKQGNGTAEPRNGHGNGARGATQSQVRALHAIAKDQGLNLNEFLREHFEVRKPEELSIKQASQAIDKLKNK